MSVWVMCGGGHWEIQGDSSVKRYTFLTEQTQAIPSRIPVMVLLHTVPKIGLFCLSMSKATVRHGPEGVSTVLSTLKHSQEES